MNESDLNRALAAGRESALPPGMEGRLLAALPAEVAAVKPLPGPAGRSVITFLLLSLAGLGTGFLVGGKGWRGLDLEQRLTLSTVLILVAAWVAWEFALRMAPAARRYLPGPAVFVATSLALTGWAVWCTPFRDESKLFYPICLAYTAAGTAAGGFLTRRWLRRGISLDTGFAWPTAGATALTGFVAVQMFCPLLDVAHIVSSHVLPALVFGSLVAGLAAWRTLR